MADTHPPANEDDLGHRSTGEDGNAMVLMPIGVLIMLMLASLAVDAALLHRTQSHLENAAAALANDVAGAVAEESLFDADADVSIDAELLRRLEVVHARASGVDNAGCTATTTDGAEPSAVARCWGDPVLIFRPAIGLGDAGQRTAVEHSTLRTG